MTTEKWTDSPGETPSTGIEPLSTAEFECSAEQAKRIAILVYQPEQKVWVEAASPEEADPSVRQIRAWSSAPEEARRPVLGVAGVRMCDAVAPHGLLLAGQRAARRYAVILRMETGN